MNSGATAHSARVALFVPALILVFGLGAVLATVFTLGKQQQREVSSMRKELETLSAGQVSLRKELGEVRELLRKPLPTAAATPVPAPPREIVLRVDGAPFKGDPNAPLTLVEFTDYECGFCARHVRDTLPLLEREYIATGKLKYVFRRFPLESIHKQAFKAHEAASCAGEQGKFWEMHDRLFENQRALAPANLIAHAESLALDVQRFQSCLDAGVRAAEVRNDLADGRKAGVTATPAFFLGLTQPNNGSVKVTTPLKGAKPYTAFKEAIDALLASPPSS